MALAVRLCVVGDSFVNGTGDPEGLGWVGRVCSAVSHQGHDLTVYNLGVRRETSADIRARWAAEVSRRLPDEATGRLIFSFGVNDTTDEKGQLRVPPQQTLVNTRAILQQARQRFPVLMIGPAPIADDELQNQRIEALSPQLAQVCAEFAVPYLDVFIPLRASPVWMTEAAANDGAHPRAGGYAEYARIVDAWDAWRSWWKSNTDSCDFKD